MIWPEAKWIGWTLFVIGSGTLVATLLWWLHVHRWRIRDWRKHLEPIHVILLGLIIALGGIIWHFAQSIPAAPAAASNSATASPQVKKFHAYDIQKRLEAVDAVDAAVARLLGPRRQAQEFLNRTNDSPDYHVIQSVASHTSNLRDHAAQTQGRPELMAHVRDSQRMLWWEQSLKTLLAWVPQVRNQLASLRREYEAAEVYDRGETGARPNAGP